MTDTYKIRLQELAGIKNEVIPPNIPNSMNFWHGGNLDDYNDVIAQKNGRYEWGPGLYLTTRYEVVQKYIRGSRKLYMVTVENGVDLNDANLKIENVKMFIDKYVVGNLKKDIWNKIQSYNKDEIVPAYYFNNIILNSKAIKSVNTKYLRQFLIDNGIDYEIVDNAFGWGEKMMVLYNMDKIITTTRIKPEDKIIVWNLLKGV